MPPTNPAYSSGSRKTKPSTNGSSSSNSKTNRVNAPSPLPRGKLSRTASATSIPQQSGLSSVPSKKTSTTKIKSSSSSSTSTKTAVTSNNKKLLKTSLEYPNESQSHNYNQYHGIPPLSRSNSGLPLSPPPTSYTSSNSSSKIDMLHSNSQQHLLMRSNSSLSTTSDTHSNINTASNSRAGFYEYSLQQHRGYQHNTSNISQHNNISSNSNSRRASVMSIQSNTSIGSGSSGGNSANVNVTVQRPKSSTKHYKNSATNVSSTANISSRSRRNDSIVSSKAEYLPPPVYRNDEKHKSLISQRSSSQLLDYSKARNNDMESSISHIGQTRRLSSALAMTNDNSQIYSQMKAPLSALGTPSNSRKIQESSSKIKSQSSIPSNLTPKSKLDLKPSKLSRKTESTQQNSIESNRSTNFFAEKIEDDSDIVIAHNELEVHKKLIEKQQKELIESKIKLEMKQKELEMISKELEARQKIIEKSAKLESEAKLNNAPENNKTPSMQIKVDSSSKVAESLDKSNEKSKQITKIASLAQKIQHVLKEGTISEKTIAKSAGLDPSQYGSVRNLLEGLEDVVGNEDKIDSKTMEIMLRLLAKQQKLNKSSSHSKKQNEPSIPTVQQMFTEQSIVNDDKVSLKSKSLQPVDSLCPTNKAKINNLDNHNNTNKTVNSNGIVDNNNKSNSLEMKYSNIESQNDRKFTETQEIVLFKKYEALLSSRNTSDTALKTNSRLLRQMILNYGLPVNSFSDSPIVEGRPLLHLLEILEEYDKKEISSCIERHKKNVGISTSSSPLPPPVSSSMSNFDSPQKQNSSSSKFLELASSRDAFRSMEPGNMFINAFDNDNSSVFREETPIGNFGLNYHNFSFVGVKGDCSLRGRVWKSLLGVYRVSATEYLHLVSKGPCSVYSKIRNDTFRTLATNKKFKARVTDDILARILNAFVWKVEKYANKSLNFQSKAESNSSILNCTYVQGMNVLLAPFTYVMPEVDAFYAFATFIEQCCPLYVQRTLEGVHSGLYLLDKCLEVCDSQLFNYLTKEKKLPASIYAFPSVMTFSCCTPPLNEVLVLWDFFLAFGVHMNILCIVAQLILMRNQLLTSRSPMKLLRVFPPLNSRKVIVLTMELTAVLPNDLYEQLVRHPYESIDIA